MKDRLYLLKPGFLEGGHGPFFCSECALVEGMLSFFPHLRERLDVRYLDFPRPRREVVQELGPDHQSLPVLVLGSPSAKVPPTVTLREANGKRFIDNDHEICNYLAALHNVAQPHA